MKNVQQTIKVRLCPSKEQKILFGKHFGCSRFVYNYFLNLKKTEYLKNEVSLSKNKCSNILTELKRKEEYSWLYEVNSQSLQAEIEHLEVAYTRFFKKVSMFPKFKSKHSDRNSFKVPQYGKINTENKTIRIPKFSDIKFRGHIKHKEINVNSIVISKNSCGHYFASIQFDGKLVNKIDNETKSSIGIDLGLKDFLTDSNGNKIENMKFLKKRIKKLKYIQKQLSKSKKGSKRRKALKNKLAALHNNISNKRRDFLHKVSTKLINENQVICVENLAAKNMVKNHKLAQAISDASWGKFVSILKYKATWYDKTLVQVGRFFPSSKTCSSCGYIKEDLILSDRTWECQGCGVNHDRDINAAKNILRQGLNEIKSGLGTKSDFKQKLMEASCTNKESLKSETKDDKNIFSSS